MGCADGRQGIFERIRSWFAEWKMRRSKYSGDGLGAGALASTDLKTSKKA